MNKNAIINLSFNKTALFVKIFEVLALFALLLYGCSSDDIAEGGDDDSAPNVSMNLRAGADATLMNNASIYVFTADDKFVEKKQNVNINNSKFSTYISAGTWNLVLLTCKTSLVGKITMPLYGAAAGTSPMWETKLISPANDFLDQTPADLSYAALPGTVITPYLKTEKDANPTRNVAKIQVILKEYNGFTGINPGKNNYAFVDLVDVPTTLNWKGEYFPNKTNPTCSAKPIREYFNFNSQLEADTINFIVPAHRGTDAFTSVHNDTTTHKLKFMISMPLNNQSYFGKSQTPIVISYVPKINKIMQLLVTFSGEPNTDLNVKVTVKEWEDTPEQEEVFN